MEGRLCRHCLPDATIFSELAKAIRNEEVVQFGYKKLDAKAYEKRTVEPWHLACVSGQWYLLGHDRTRKARRIFVLARLQKVSRTAHKFSHPRPAAEEIQRLFRNSFQIWQSENTASSRSYCGSAAVPRSSFANGTGIPASRSRS